MENGVLYFYRGMVMRKSVLFIVILLCCAVSAFAAEGDSSQVFLTAKADLTACLFSAYATPAVSLVWQPKILGIGAEARGLIGLADGDVYLVALGLVKVWWFYAGVGIDLPVSYGSTGMSISSDGLLPAITLGLDAPLWQIGPGKLGINAGVDFILTAIAADSEDPFGAAIGSLIMTVYGSVKADIGITYSIPL
jgi:hypothetical protein